MSSWESLACSFCGYKSSSSFKSYLKEQTLSSIINLEPSALTLRSEVLGKDST